MRHIGCGGKGSAVFVLALASRTTVQGTEGGGARACWRGDEARGEIRRRGKGGRVVTGSRHWGAQLRFLLDFFSSFDSTDARCLIHPGFRGLDLISNGNNKEIVSISI